jgi:EmrB/QacA subfamily drug resistance transporter
MFRSLETKWLVAIAFVFGIFMEILDMTVLNTALPAIGRAFDVSESQLQYPLTGYLVSLAIFIPASGWVGDRFGTKRTFAFAIAIFTAASALAGAANSLEMLVGARVLQGIGGGMMVPVGTTMLFRAFPHDERAKAGSVLAMPTMIAPALGPVLGGWLTDNYSWRWIFYINLPIGLLGLIFTLAFVPDDAGTQTVGKFDIPGFLLGGIGLATLLVGVERGPSHGWGDPSTLGLILPALVILAIFVIVELRIKEPLLDLRLLKERYFRSGNITLFIATGTFMGVLFLFPLFLQQIRGLDATGSGLVTVFQVLGMFVVFPNSAKLYSALGARYSMIIGFTVMALTIGSMEFVDYDSSLWIFRAQLFIFGVGLAFAFVPLQAVTFERISMADTSNASALFSTSRQIASAVGVSIVSSVLTLRTDAHLGDLPAAASEAMVKAASFSAYQNTFLFSGVCAVIGVAFAFVFKGRKSQTGEATADGDIREAVIVH